MSTNKHRRGWTRSKFGKKDWLGIGHAVWLLHWSLGNAITKDVTKILKLLRLTCLSVLRVASLEKKKKKRFKIYFGGIRRCPWSGTGGQKENCGCCPQNGSCWVFWAQTKPLTGSTEAFASFKGASVPDNSVWLQDGGKLRRGKREKDRETCTMT